MFESFAALLADHQQQGFVVRRSGRRTYRAHVAVGPPADPVALAAVEASLGHPLPPDLRAFLARWDGAQIFVDEERGGSWAPYPCLFDTDRLRNPDFQLPFQDPRVLVIGQLADEAFLILDRRLPHRAGWPVHWADELDAVEEILGRPAIAGSFHEFLDRWVAAQGEWYWDPEPPLIWRPDTPGLWRFGTALYLVAALHPRPMYRLGLPSGRHPMTPPVARVAAGLRQHLLALGGQPLDPGAIGWERSGRFWLFAFQHKPLPPVDPAAVPALDLPAGWQEVAPGIWLHGPEEASFWVCRGLGYDGRPHATYTVSWHEASAADAVAALRQRLAAAVGEPSLPNYVQPGYEAEEFHWYSGRGAPPDIRPV